MRTRAKSVVSAERGHAEHIAANLRKVDYDEALALYGQDPRELVIESFLRSGMCWTGMHGDEPVCIFGAVELDQESGVGSVWLVGTDALTAFPKTFLALSRPHLEAMLQCFRRLTNAVDVRNTSSLKWLRWLGARFYEPEPLGVNGELFVRFDIGGASC